MSDAAQVVPRWDTDLGKEEVSRLCPADKGQRTQTSLLRKVEFLEQLATENLSSERLSVIPGDRAKLRRWNDADLRLWPWSDPLIDARDGRHSALMARFQSALASIKQKGRRRHVNFRQELEAKDRVIAALEAQNLELMTQIECLQALPAPKIVRRSRS